MKIYDFDGFPNPARVRIALAEKGAMDKVQFVRVDVPAGEHRRPEFLAKNPGGTVPLLELDDGTCISECTAITEYIDRVFEGPSLVGQGGKERAVVHMMQRRAEQGVFDAVAAYFHHATPGLGPSIELYQNKDWGLKQRERALLGMSYFDTVLARDDHVAGANYSMADITLFVGLGYADFAKIGVPSEYRHLHAWRARIARRRAIAGG